MKTLLQLTKKRDDALKAVANAATDKDRTEALGALESASLALATFKSRLDSKSVKVIKKEEKYEETDDEEDEDEEEGEEAEDEDEDEESKKSDDEPKKPASKKAKSEDDDDSDDDDDDSDDSDDDEDEDEEEDADEEEEDEESDEDADEDEDEEEDEKAAAAAVGSAKSMLRKAKKAGSQKMIAEARAHLRAVKRAASPKALGKYAALKSACQRVTGKKSIAAMVGALDALKATSKATEKLASDVAKIKLANRRTKVDALLTTARREGKVTKAEVSHLRERAIRSADDVRWLRGYLSAMPKKVRSVTEPLVGKSEDGDETTAPPAPKTRSEILDSQKLSPEQRKFIEQAAQDAGMKFDDFLASMQQTASKANGTPRA